MSEIQEQTYLRLRDAGYEYCHTEGNGDVIVAKYARTTESESLLYAVSIHADGKFTEIVPRSA